MPVTLMFCAMRGGWVECWPFHRHGLLLPPPDGLADGSTVTATGANSVHSATSPPGPVVEPTAPDASNSDRSAASMTYAALR